MRREEADMPGAQNGHTPYAAAFEAAFRDQAPPDSRTALVPHQASPPDLGQAYQAYGGRVRLPHDRSRYGVLPSDSPYMERARQLVRGHYAGAIETDYLDGLTQRLEDRAYERLEASTAVYARSIRRQDELIQAPLAAVLAAKVRRTAERSAILIDHYWEDALRRRSKLSEQE